MGWATCVKCSSTTTTTSVVRTVTGHGSSQKSCYGYAATIGLAGAGPLVRADLGSPIGHDGMPTGGAVAIFMLWSPGTFTVECEGARAQAMITRSCASSVIERMVSIASRRRNSCQAAGCCARDCSNAASDGHHSSRTAS